MNGYLYAIDISPAMLRHAERHCRNARVASAYSLPFPPCAFDVVTCSSALHHLENLGRVLGEAYRVLRPGGIFLSDYDNSVQHANLVRLMRRLLNLMLVAPALAKIFQRGSRHRAPFPDRAPRHPTTHEMEHMGTNDLHRLAEVQNLRHDGIDGYRLQDLLRNAGFAKAHVFVFHSHRFRDGKPFTFWNNIFNNKMYSISTKPSVQAESRRDADGQREGASTA